LYPVLSRINAYLVGWVRKKYKRLRSKKKARVCWQGVTERYPRMFTHWKWLTSIRHV
jgi:RNA-directed DNA polymerase